ncbi:MAG: LicD family protein [Oscillospiraceae bacterium]|nr:LicD family protein [Oscillospiraceae bacterium]MDD4413159.1 LicD family protein [Oscillospiraceae bacterium]
MNENNVRNVQMKILEIMKYIDGLCRSNNIVYYIMGGTALGAVRHGGFIPWDDDLDIFMTPDNYLKFKDVFEQQKSDLFILQEWRVCEEYLEYAKVRMNGTTFIEHSFKDRKDLHQGIYVDIMILHKCPANSMRKLKEIYYKSKYVTLYALSQRNWKPKNFTQKATLAFLRILPNKWLVNKAYRTIYQYDSWQDNFQYCYYITKASLSQGVFDADMFSEPVDVPFEDTILSGSAKIKEYLAKRYGDYMKLPTEDQQKYAVHAEIFDVNKGYEAYLAEE